MCNKTQEPLNKSLLITLFDKENSVDISDPIKIFINDKKTHKYSEIFLEVSSTKSLLNILGKNF